MSPPHFQIFPTVAVAILRNLSAASPLIPTAARESDVTPPHPTAEINAENASPSFSGWL